MERTVKNIMERYGCDEKTAQRYIDLREEGYSQYVAAVMSGLRDPDESNEG